MTQHERPRTVKQYIQDSRRLGSELERVFERAAWNRLIVVGDFNQQVGQNGYTASRRNRCHSSSVLAKYSSNWPGLSAYTSHKCQTEIGPGLLGGRWLL